MFFCMSGQWPPAPLLLCCDAGLMVLLMCGHRFGRGYIASSKSMPESPSNRRCRRRILSLLLSACISQNPPVELLQ